MVNCYRQFIDDRVVPCKLCGSPALVMVGGVLQPAVVGCSNPECKNDAVSNPFALKAIEGWNLLQNGAKS